VSAELVQRIGDARRHPLRQAPTLIHHATVNAVQPQVTVVTPTF